MASGQTEHYGLSQWESGDAFLREEFNEDHRKVDAALHELKATVERIHYNTYNLALQHYYDRKETGFKKALVFDGFLDESMVASKSTAVVVTGAAARLWRAAQPALSWGNTSGNYQLKNGPFQTPMTTAEGPMLVRSFTFPYQCDSTSSSASLGLYRNGALVWEKTGLRLSASANFTPTTVTLEEPVLLTPGDSFYFKLTGNIIGFYIYTTNNGHALSGSVTFDDLSGTTGRLTAASTEGLPAWERASLYLRYAGGAVTPTLPEVTLTRADSRQTLNLNGEPCTEDRWALGPGADRLALTLDLSTGPDGTCAVYDYGILLMG